MLAGHETDTIGDAGLIGLIFVGHNVLAFSALEKLVFSAFVATVGIDSETLAVVTPCSVLAQ